MSRPSKMICEICSKNITMSGSLCYQTCDDHRYLCDACFAKVHPHATESNEGKK